MDRARRKGSAGDSDVFIAAEPGAPIKDMCCAFSLCVGAHEVDVHFIPRRGLEGDRYVQSAHYATVAGQRKKHHPACNLVSSFEDASAENESLRKAVLAGKTILINLNLNPDSTNAKKPPRYRTNRSEYDQWCKRNKSRYKPISVHSEEEYQHVIDLIYRYGGEAAVQKTMIGYRNRIRSYAEFDVGTDTNKLLEAVKKLARGENVISKKPDRNDPGTVYIDGFPLRITLMPGGKAWPSRNPHSKTIRIPSPDLVVKSNDIIVTLSPSLFLCSNAGDDELARKILDGNTVSMIVMPSQIERALNMFKDSFARAVAGASQGERKQLSVSLRLTAFSPSQITVVGTKTKAVPIAEAEEPELILAPAEPVAEPPPQILATGQFAEEVPPPAPPVERPRVEQETVLSPQQTQDLLFSDLPPAPMPQKPDHAKRSTRTKKEVRRTGTDDQSFLPGFGPDEPANQ